ncbi:MAG: fibronectin type III domain-containing protein [Elusimicrobiaceae bacterium]|nr:fibronectin type III domain-containing protein [Elusimicrobiaceae bacterium]
MHRRVSDIFNRLAGGFLLMCGLGVVCLGPAYAVSLEPAAAGVTAASAKFEWTRVPAAAPLAVLSTDSFSTVYSSQTLAAATSWYIYTPLAGDTTYYFMVKIASEPDTEYASVSTRTVPVTPSGADITYIAETALLLEWATGSNPETTQYEVSVEPGGILVTGAFAGMYIAGGLDPNTEYTARVRALGASGPTSYSNNVASSTFARHIQGVSAAHTSDAVSVAWAPYPAAPQADSCSGYLLEVSSYNDFSVAASSSTAEITLSTLVISGLSPNTTYYYRAGALNGAGAVSYSDVYSFSTLAAAPAGLALTGLWQSSATLRWDPMALSPPSASAQGFVLEASSTGFDGSGTLLSSITYSASVTTLTLSGLLRHTGYSFRAGALNWPLEPNYGAVISSHTMSWPVDGALVVFSPSSTEVLINYVPLPLVPEDLACDGYMVAFSSRTDGSAPIHFSSTSNPSASGFTLSGLSANRQYTGVAGTYNQDGAITLTSTLSFITASGRAPGDVVVLSTGIASITMGWSALDCDGYIMQVSTDMKFTGVIKFSSTTNGSAVSLTVSGLDINEGYYARAGSIYNGASVYSDVMRVATLAPPVVTASFGTVGTTAARLSWNNISLGSGYEAQLSTAADYSGLIYSSGGYSSDIITLEIQNLVPNTTYYGRVGTLNVDGVPNFTSIAGTTVTYAADPYGPVATDVQTDAITFSWNTNNNPAATRYRVRNYLSPGVLFSSALVTGASHTFDELISNTSYYIDITVFGHNGHWGEVVEMGVVITAANEPRNLTLVAVNVSSVSVSFEANGNPAQTRYLLQAATVPFEACGTGGERCARSEKTVQLVSGEISTTAAVSGMYSNAQYYIRAAAVNVLDISSWSAVVIDTQTRAGVPAYADNVATRSFSNVYIDQLTLNWAHGTNFPGSTVYEAYISTNSAFSPDVFVSSVSTTAVSATFVQLSSGTTHYAWVLAKGLNTDSAVWNTVSTVTLNSVISTTTPNTEYTVSLPFSYGNATVYIPARTFNSSTDVMLAQAVGLSSGMAVTSPAANLRPTGLGVTIVVSPAAQPNLSLKITIPYRSEDLPADTNTDRLVLAFRDESRNVWVPLPSVSHAVLKNVEGVAAHLSTFQIMEMLPSASVEDIKIFPNPFNPNTSNQYMQFTKLPSGASVKIFTYLGELVREMTADISGNAKWDGKNTYGSNVASGVYIVMVKSADGGAGKILKLAVQR